ncbi:sensor histidine kinase [Oenococcus sicerae]|uniref:sensor histidine kinase n=1 Tax=Oenococcus sicerae TaxID=2203724 RepID=UPI0010B25541|nr:Sensor histidine kinase ResE [Oenococcus sicerae]
MKLRAKEIRHLTFFGAVTAIVLLFLDWSVFIFFAALLSNSFRISRGKFYSSVRVMFDGQNFTPKNAQWWGFAIILILGIILWIFLFLREYQQLQLKRLSDEITKINETNDNDRIKMSSIDPMVTNLVSQINQMTQAKQAILNTERENEKKQKELVTNVSHDLRTPLTSIIGYLGLIESNPDIPADQMRKHASTAYSKAQQLVAMVEDLFSYSQTQTNGENLHFQPMEISEFFDQLIVQFSLDADKHHITMSSLTNPDQIQIVADPEKLARLFMNLINNAFKYGKTMTFIKLTAAKRDDKVEIKVQNDGEQIPKASLLKLFDRFYRVDQSGNKEISGTGLGLAISQGIVQQHHGSIHAESNSQLTSFVIELPVDASLGLAHD